MRRTRKRTRTKTRRTRTLSDFLMMLSRFTIYASYALAFWYGVKLIMDDRESCEDDPSDCSPRYTASSLLIVRRRMMMTVMFLFPFCKLSCQVFLSVLMGALEIGQATPYVEAFSMAKAAAAIIFAIIDR